MSYNNVDAWMMNGCVSEQEYNEQCSSFYAMIDAIEAKDSFDIAEFAKESVKIDDAKEVDIF
jgi:hypothetical protein